MTCKAAQRRQRHSDNEHMLIRRRDLKAAIQAGFAAWTTSTGSGLHPGMRAEIFAHLVAAITRAADTEPNSQPKTLAPAARRWWNDPREQEGEQACVV